MNCSVNTRAAASDYREYAPPPSLADHFLCFWNQSITGGEYAQRVLPDGCIDLVFINDEAPIVVGPWTKPFIARLPVASEIIGARWHPGRAPGLLGLPAVELLNQSVALRDVWCRRLSSSFERVSEQPNISARRSAIEDSLLNLLADAAPGDRIVNASIRWLALHPHGRVGQLSRWIGISSRQLQRRFLESVGYSPKAFQSILRFQRLLYFAGRGLHLSGCAPTVLLPSAQCALQMSDFFKPRP
jgi:AraC-like DNA-binding protein